MRKSIYFAVIAMIASFISVIGLASPASAAYTNCQHYYSRIAWDVESFSPWGTIAWVRAEVHWNNCTDSTGGPTRNNADFAVLSLKGDNCEFMSGMRFNLGPIEGLDLGYVSVDCNEGSTWTTKVVDLSSPGYTFEKKQWHVDASKTVTANGFYSLGITNDPTRHGPAPWGGRANLFY